MSAAEKTMPEPLPCLTAAKIFLVSVFFSCLFPPAIFFLAKSLGVAVKGNVWFLLGWELYFPTLCALGGIGWLLHADDCRYGISRLHFTDGTTILGGWLFALAGNLCICLGWKKLLEFLQWDFSTRQSILEMAQNSPATVFWLLFLFTAGIVPFFEEIVFRRALYSLLLPLGKGTALITGAAIFSAMHFFLLGAPGLFFFGIVLQLLFLRTKNLLVPIAVHSLFNASAMIAAHFGQG